MYKRQAQAGARFGGGGGVCAREGQSEGDGVAGIEAGIDAPKRGETANHQSGADEQNQGLSLIHISFTQRRVTQGLEDTVRAKVSFAKFRKVYFPNPGCVAEDVTFAASSNAGEAAPLITIHKLEIEARYADLIVRPGYIARVVLNGLRVHAPLQGIGGKSSASQSSQGPEVRIGEIVADGGELEVCLLYTSRCV